MNGHEGFEQSETRNSLTRIGSGGATAWEGFRYGEITLDFGLVLRQKELAEDQVQTGSIPFLRIGDRVYRFGPDAASTESDLTKFTEDEQKLLFEFQQIVEGAVGTDLFDPNQEINKQNLEGVFAGFVQRLSSYRVNK